MKKQQQLNDKSKMLKEESEKNGRIYYNDDDAVCGIAGHSLSFTEMRSHSRDLENYSQVY